MSTIRMNVKNTRSFPSFLFPSPPHPLLSLVDGEFYLGIRHGVLFFFPFLYRVRWG